MITLRKLKETVNRILKDLLDLPFAVGKVKWDNTRRRPKLQILPLNFKGTVPTDITWIKAKSYWELGKIFPIVPKNPHCPCGKPLYMHPYDWQDIEDSGQFMVKAYICPSGCGAYLDIA